MTSEYDPIGGSRDDPLAADDLDQVRDLFEQASRPFLAQPWSWLVWSLILPATALSTRWVLAHWGGVGVLFLWSGAVIVGGLVEAGQILRASRQGLQRSTLATWVLRAQGNLSLVGLFVSVALVLEDLAWMLPGLWLLLLGHSLFSIGGLAARGLRGAGLIYQVGGLLAIWPHGRGLELFAAAMLAGNLWAAWSIWREASGNRSGGPPASDR